MVEQEKPKISYETLWKAIIRPYRDIYKIKDLGNPKFSFFARTYIRKDYDLISSEGYLMKCSFYEPEISFRPKKIMPVVLYLHGNSSSRLEGMGVLREVLKRDMNLFTIDFPGCGLSEGDYISLGYHESRDVKVVVDFIEKLPGVGNIGLWGRSMGAATTMIYAHKDDRIKAIVMDSPFADFSILAKELVLKQIKLPNFLIDGALKIVNMTVRKKNGLDIEKLKPIDSAPKTKQPAIFVHANNDELINNRHSEMLLNAYGGKNKKLKRCEGNHNSRRPFKIMKEIGEFLYNNLVNNNPNINDNKKVDDFNNIFNLDLYSEEDQNKIEDENQKNEINTNKIETNPSNNKEIDKNEINLNNNEIKEKKEEEQKNVIEDDKENKKEK
jgi:pimeloyl-ACP methyl ester carboxylesterase